MFDGWNSWPFRRRSTLATIKALDADLIGLQEAYRFQFRWIRERLAAYESRWDGRGPSGRGEGCPVFSRRAVATILDHQTRWFGGDPDRRGGLVDGATYPRIATTCRVQLTETQPVLQFTSAHLSSHSADRRRQSAAQLVDWLDLDLPQIVAGDFNASPGDQLFEPLAAAGLRAGLPADAGGTNHDFNGRRDGRQLDHILVSSHFEVIDAGVFYDKIGRRLPSDHWPVTATVRLRDG